jgi:predicted secreted protein
MAAKNGRTLIVKITNGDSPETWTVIAGAQETAFTITNGEIDITSNDDNGRVARLGGGNQDISITVSGVEKDEVLLADAYSNVAQRYQLEYEDTGATITGTFEIGSYEATGSTDNGAIMFSAQFRPTLGTWVYAAGA